MSVSPIGGLSARAHQLLEQFGFERSPRERSGLAAHLDALGLPIHELALDLDALAGGLFSPRTRSVGWLELGVWEELDEANERSAQRREALDESEVVGGTWPHVSLHGEPVVPVGGGCDTTYLASAHCIHTHDRMLDEVSVGPKSPQVFVEQRLLAMALSAIRGGDGGSTWEIQNAEMVDRVALTLQLTPLPEASDENETWWSSGSVLAVRTVRGGRLVGPEAAVNAARSLP